MGCLKTIGPPGFQAQMERCVCRVSGDELTDDWLQHRSSPLCLDGMTIYSGAASNGSTAISPRPCCFGGYPSCVAVCFSSVRI